MHHQSSHAAPQVHGVLFSETDLTGVANFTGVRLRGALEETFDITYAATSQFRSLTLIGKVRLFCVHSLVVITTSAGLALLMRGFYTCKLVKAHTSVDYYLFAGVVMAEVVSHWNCLSVWTLVKCHIQEFERMPRNVQTIHCHPFSFCSCI